jgi:predicted RNase H-like HicB family nuclease
VNRPRYTVVATAVTEDAWHLTVRELPETWTVAFSAEELESRARVRIALDTQVAPEDFELTIVRVDAR